MKTKTMLAYAIDTTASKAHYDQSYKNLSDEFNIQLTREMEGEVFKLCNFSEEIEERGIAIGLEQGLELLVFL
ncbi:MAG: hypothetical protein LBM69_09395 [Lachnospiraceae bacterium]|jgi:hypothetical protein|nr:hypothetical protein [Lachnospiraceae bacterium]